MENGEFKSLAINYHKCIKKIMKRSWSYSNHDVCEEAGLPTFKHLHNLRLISFCFQLINSKSVCLSPYMAFLINDSMIIKRTQCIFLNNYDVVDFLNNDLDAIKSRVFFVQNREDRSNYHLREHCTS